jgi:AAA15 family ATPase/GTPase
MLIEFSVGNYRSFKERVTFSMEAAEIASQPSSLDEHNVFAPRDELRLLTSAAIYGANASGKSNLIRGLGFVRSLVLGSSRETQVGELIPTEPFQLSTTTFNQPSEFELVFLVDQVQYRYGFSATPMHVVREWLYRLGSAREAALFKREAGQINVNQRTFREGRGLEERTRPNALFLSVVAQFNGPIAGSILAWFQRLGLSSGVDHDTEMIQALHHFETSPYRQAVVQLVQQLDVGISNIAVERLPAAPPRNAPPALAESFRLWFEGMEKAGQPIEQISVKTYHHRYDTAGQLSDDVVFDLEEQESAGTKRLFALAYPVIRALREGLVLVADEIDARIHPNLVIELIRLFNDPATNPHHAQLIFTTHNTNLLSAKLFRRDQIWFVEKSRQGASDLYSLVEYRLDGNKVVRNDASFEKDYIAGRYGAVPFIGDLSALLGAEREQTAES